MATNFDLVRDVMSGYAVEGENGHSYLTHNADDGVLAVIYVSEFRGQRHVDTGLLVELQGEQVIIVRDQNDKPLVDALVQAGVPREKVVLMYIGETVEETV